MNLDKRLEKVKQKRKRKNFMEYAIIGGGFLALILIIVLIAVGTKSCGKNENPEEVPAETQMTPAETVSATESPEEIAKKKKAAEEAEKQRVLDELLSGYSNLAIVEVSDGGYLNMRQEPNKDAAVVGKLYDHCGCSVLDNPGGYEYDPEQWAFVESGGIKGFVSAEFLITGDDARKLAPDFVKERAVVNTDVLYIRSDPSTDAEIRGTIYKNERYEILGNSDGWIRIDRGYIKADYVDIVNGLDEARKLDLKQQVLNLYDNLGISDVQSYLNIRESASEDGKIIGKLPSKAGADILKEENGWYYIRSGPVKGYVKGDYILTGNDASIFALNQAELMAIVATDVLNVRTRPSTDSSICTQITNKERYPVSRQLDGWVEIEIEGGDSGEPMLAYASTDYVDVKYALNEAIKFSPLEEAMANANRLRTKVCNYALQYLGNPYVWGGTSLTKGCDCSGFTMKVMSNFGVSLPHFSGSQAQLGKKVTSSSMRPGDLIFYANSGGTINHVAIYIGNGQIVHAASRKSGIKISTWNYRSPVAIRNVLGD